MVSCKLVKNLRLSLRYGSAYRKAPNIHDSDAR